MKKVISLLLALVMCLSLCACGGDNDTPEATETPTEATEEQLSKEDLIANAITTDITTLQTAVYQNEVKAKQDYCGKPIIVSGKAIRVEDDHVEICDSQVSLDAYLSIDELVKISTQTNITVVGIISDIQDVESNWGGINYTFPHYIMEVAYLIEN